jgi:hypothetical protein
MYHQQNQVVPTLQKPYALIRECAARRSISDQSELLERLFCTSQNKFSMTSKPVPAPKRFGQLRTSVVDGVLNLGRITLPSNTSKKARERKGRRIDGWKFKGLNT